MSANFLVSMKFRDVVAAMSHAIGYMECQARSKVLDLFADPAEIGNTVDIRGTDDPAVTRKSLKGKGNFIQLL
jgi:hypothetical protein